MNPTFFWALLAIIAIGIVFAITRVIAADKARAKAAVRPTLALANPDDAPTLLSESQRNVALTCRVNGHAYAPFDTGFRCATCGNHVSSSEGDLYGLAKDGRHERRREAR